MDMIKEATHIARQSAERSATAAQGAKGGASARSRGRLAVVNSGKRSAQRGWRGLYVVCSVGWSGAPDLRYIAVADVRAVATEAEEYPPAMPEIVQYLPRCGSKKGRLLK